MIVVQLTSSATTQTVGYSVCGVMPMKLGAEHVCVTMMIYKVIGVVQPVTPVHPVLPCLTVSSATTVSHGICFEMEVYGGK